MPGASRSITMRVASGVTSRLENPVPPVVRISEIPASHMAIISSASICRSSGRITLRATS